MAPTWNSGQINWGATDGAQNVVQVQTAGPTGPFLYWWREELAGETLSNACRDFYRQFPFPVFKSNCQSCIVQEWSPDGQRLVQDEEFSFTTSELNLFSED